MPPNAPKSSETARAKGPEPPGNRWQQWLHGALVIWKQYNDDHGPLAAAAIAFYLTLSMIPLLLFLVSVAAFFISPAQITLIGRNLTASLGAGVGGALRSQVLSVVEHRGLLTGIALVLGLWTASQFFVVIEAALNDVWDVTEHRSFWVQRGLALAMVVVTGVLGLLAVALSYLPRVLERLPGVSIHHLPWFLAPLFNVVFPWLLASLTLLIIYRYLSASKVSWHMAWPGAVVAGLLWAVALQLFSWYSATFSDYSVLYGSLGGLVLLMLWFNYSGMILLLGAELSCVIYQQRHATAPAH